MYECTNNSSEKPDLRGQRRVISESPRLLYHLRIYSELRVAIQFNWIESRY